MAEAARPDEWQQLDSKGFTSVRGPLAPQRRLGCVGLDAIAHHVAECKCFLGFCFRDVLLVDDLAQQGHSVRSVLIHALAHQVAACDWNQRRTEGFGESLTHECEPLSLVHRHPSACVPGQKETAEGGLCGGVSQVRSLLKPSNGLHSVLPHALTG
jgi:hypothetical protein